MKLKEYLIQNLQYYYSRLCESRSESSFNDIIINQNDIDMLNNLEKAEYNQMETMTFKSINLSSWMGFYDYR